MFNCQLFRDLSVEVSQTYWSPSQQGSAQSLRGEQTPSDYYVSARYHLRHVKIHTIDLGESGRRMCELCFEMKGNIHESNLSLWSPHRPVIICPADVCPDQQAARPQTAAPHPGFAQSQTRSVCGAQSHRAPELPQPLSEIGRTPADTLSIHIYFTSCVNKPEEQHWKKINLCQEIKRKQASESSPQCEEEPFYSCCQTSTTTKAKKNREMDLPNKKFQLL